MNSSDPTVGSNARQRAGPALATPDSSTPGSSPAVDSDVAPAELLNYEPQRVDRTWTWNLDLPFAMVAACPAIGFAAIALTFALDLDESLKLLGVCCAFPASTVYGIVAGLWALELAQRDRNLVFAVLAVVNLVPAVVVLLAVFVLVALAVLQ